jgi:hypothetical protein
MWLVPLLVLAWITKINSNKWQMRPCSLHRSGLARPFDPRILIWIYQWIWSSDIWIRHWYAAFWGLLSCIGWERTRLIGCGGSGSLVALDCKDWCNTLMLNPLSPQKHIRLPRHPKWSQMATLQACILCPETATGVESFVVITFFAREIFCSAWVTVCFHKAFG